MTVIWIVSPGIFLLLMFAEVLFGGRSQREINAEWEAHWKERREREEKWNSPEEVEQRRERDAYIAHLDAIRAKLKEDASDPHQWHPPAIYSGPRPAHWG